MEHRKKRINCAFIVVFRENREIVVSWNRKSPAGEERVSPAGDWWMRALI